MRSWGRRPPRVSVIVATYNWSSVLRHAVASALEQAFDDFELLVVGDVDAYFVNVPTRPYDHARPDKRRLPLDTPLIPASVAPRAGG